MAETPTPFQMSRISIQGGLGAGLLIAVVIGSMLAELPLLRAPTLAVRCDQRRSQEQSARQRRQRPLDARTPPLSLRLHEGGRRRR